MRKQKGFSILFNKSTITSTTAPGETIQTLKSAKTICYLNIKKTLAELHNGKTKENQGKKRPVAKVQIVCKIAALHTGLNYDCYKCSECCKMLWVQQNTLKATKHCECYKIPPHPFKKYHKKLLVANTSEYIETDGGMETVLYMFVFSTPTCPTNRSATWTKIQIRPRANLI